MEAPKPPKGKRTSRRFDDSAPIPLSVERMPNLKLTCREAAEILGATWSEDRVHEFAKAGAIPCYSVGSRIYIREDELREWIASPRSLEAKERNLKAFIDSALLHATALVRSLEEAKRQIGGS